MKPILTISVLISNHIERVKRCLDSIQPILDKISSELILTDTGCDVATRQLIEQYADSVIEYKWNDNFAEARNVGLKIAQGEWFLWIDDDEWFDDASAIITFFESGVYKQYSLAYYYQRNYTNNEGTHYEDFRVQRMVRNNKEIHFIYSIHEVITGIDQGDAYVCDAYVNHFGYVGTMEDRMNKAKRNLKLLCKEREDRPNDLHIMTQMLQCYEGLEQWNEMLDVVTEGLHCESGIIGDDEMYNTLYVYHILALQKMGDIEEALHIGKRYLLSGVVNEYNCAGIIRLLVTILYNEQKWEELLKAAENYWEIYEDYRRNLDKYERQMSVCASYLTNISRDMIISYSIRAGLINGNEAAVQEWFSRYDFDDPGLFIDTDVIDAIINNIILEKGSNLCVGIISQLMEQTDYQEYVGNQILASADNTNELLYFKGVDASHWICNLIKIVNEQGTKSDVDILFVKFEKANRYMVKYDVIGKCLNTISEAIRPKYYELSKVFDNRFWESDAQIYQYWLKWSLELFDKNSFQELLWRVVDLDWQLSHQQDVIVAEKVKELLHEYGVFQRRLCEKKYNQTVIQEAYEMLDSWEQVAYILQELEDNPNCIARVKKLMPHWVLIR